jgi:thiamine pyrophosphokinase
MESEGLAWPLSGLVWGPGGFGLSNEALGGRVRIRAGKGRLLVVRPRGAQTRASPARG